MTTEEKYKKLCDRLIKLAENTYRDKYEISDNESTVEGSLKFRVEIYTDGMTIDHIAYPTYRVVEYNFKTYKKIYELLIKTSLNNGAIRLLR